MATFCTSDSTFDLDQRNRNLIKTLLQQIILPAMLVFAARTIHAQPEGIPALRQAEELLDARGEVIIRFCLPSGYDVHFFSSRISVDRVRGDTIEAYLNKIQYHEFIKLGIPFAVVPPPSLKIPAADAGLKSSVAEEDPYPSYAEYIGLMEGYARDHPQLCRLVEFGTSVRGRKLLALKISDNPAVREQEPVFLYTSTMHGDEVAGFMLLLNLAGELLSGYGTDSLVTRLVSNIEIWINPLANPDGTYFISDSSVFGATRLNANHADLNRNFPGLPANDHPDSMAWQPETIAMMNWMKELHVVLAANLHCGSEVVNYPWDTWSRLHADDGWYRQISRAYADTVHNYSPSGYMSFLDNGITNGYAWYSITGGRQDYTNYYLHGREITLEISDQKYPYASQLADLWSYNRKSLLELMGQALYGVRGKVTDSATNEVLEARLTLMGYDSDHSEVYSSPGDGQYYRMLRPGSYRWVVHSPGYAERQFSVTLGEKETVTADLRLTPLETNYLVYPNPFEDRLFFYPGESSGELKMDLYDICGRRLHTLITKVNEREPAEIPLSFLTNGTYIGVFAYRGKVFTRVLARIRP